MWELGGLWGGGVVDQRCGGLEGGGRVAGGEDDGREWDVLKMPDASSLLCGGGADYYNAGPVLVGSE